MAKMSSICGTVDAFQGSSTGGLINEKSGLGASGSPVVEVITVPGTAASITDLTGSTDPALVSLTCRVMRHSVGSSTKVRVQIHVTLGIGAVTGDPWSGLNWTGAELGAYAPVGAAGQNLWYTNDATVEPASVALGRGVMETTAAGFNITQPGPTVANNAALQQFLGTYVAEYFV